MSYLTKIKYLQRLAPDDEQLQEKEDCASSMHAKCITLWSRRSKIFNFFCRIIDLIPFLSPAPLFFVFSPPVLCILLTPPHPLGCICWDVNCKWPCIASLIILCFLRCYILSNISQQLKRQDYWRGSCFEQKGRSEEQNKWVSVWCQRMVLKPLVSLTTYRGAENPPIQQKEEWKHHNKNSLFHATICAAPF